MLVGSRRAHAAGCHGRGGRTEGDAEFAAEAGAGASDEMQRLAGEPVVKEFLLRLRSRTMLEQTQTFLENIDPGAAARRGQAQARPTRFATGDAALLDEIEQVSSAPLDYVDANKTKSMERFL